MKPTIPVSGHYAFSSPVLVDRLYGPGSCVFLRKPFLEPGQSLLVIPLRITGEKPHENRSPRLRETQITLLTSGYPPSSAPGRKISAPGGAEDSSR